MMNKSLFLMLAAAMMATPSHAQERDRDRDAPPKSKPEARRDAKPADRDRPKDEGRRPPPREDRDEGKGAEHGEMRPFLGVAMEPVPPQLRAHFDIPDGFGVMVGMVMEDSPAAKAGLRKHDLLIGIDDQKVANIDQVQALIRSSKQGERVKLTVISKGKERVVDVVLDERRMHVGHHEHHGGRPQMMERMREWGSQFDGMQVWRQAMEHFQDRMREYQERLRDWEQDGRPGPMPKPPVMQPPSGPGRAGMRPPGERREMDEGRFRRPPADSPREIEERERRESTRSEITNQSSATVVTRRDESGEYTLSRNGDVTVFAVRPTEGENQRWDVSHGAVRESIPPEFQEKLEILENIRVERE